jgi:hypothetical protein
MSAGSLAQVLAPRQYIRAPCKKSVTGRMSKRYRLMGRSPLP